MSEVSLFRLYVLRATYFVLVVGVGLQMGIWRLLFQHRAWDDVMHGVAVCLFAAVTAMALVGLRYPLRMLPLLFFELAWKTIWLLAIALPAWHTGTLTDPIRETVFACALGVVIFPLAIPWVYVWRHYIAAPGDRWR